MEQQQEQEVLPTLQQEAAPEEEVSQTKSVKNFWERLDEVFTQNTELRERMEELVSQFPDTAKSDGPARSFLFQPERICISSNDDPSTGLITNISDYQTDEAGNVASNGGHQIGEMFSTFRIRLERALLEVKSIQLLSAVIPNAIQSIPDNSTVFYYYKIPNLTLSSPAFNIATTYNSGDTTFYAANNTFYVCIKDGTIGILPPADATAWTSIGIDGTRPNYFAITADNMNAVFLNPTTSYSADFTPANLENTYNRTFSDYEDLVGSLNACALSASRTAGTAPPGTIQFAYDPQLNKIQMIPNATQIAAGYYFFPAGYDDPNIPIFMEPGVGGGGIYEELVVNFERGYTLNLRLGFTWNGFYQNPLQNNPYTPQSLGTIRSTIYWYMRPTDPAFGPANAFAQNTITANSYGDLVNTSCVRVYCDFIYGSTQDSNNQQGLLSIVPVNASNLGVAFYQNNFYNALTKIPRIITEIGIRLVNDQGLPYLLPNSAVVLLELAVEYK